MKPYADKRVILLFAIIGLGSGLLTAALSTVSTLWLWIGPGATLCFSLLISAGIARGQRWLVGAPTLVRSIGAATVIVLAYPISMLVMISSFVLYDLWLASNFSTVWHESVKSGVEPPSEWALYLAAVVAALLVSFGLRLITRKFDFQVVSLMVIAGLATIPLSQLLGRWMGEANWHLILFPIGQTFFNGLAGCWWVRTSPVNLSTAPPALTNPTESYGVKDVKVV